MSVRLAAVLIGAVCCAACATGRVCDRGLMVRSGWRLTWPKTSLPLTIGNDAHGNKRHLAALLRAAEDINALTGVYLFSLYAGHNGLFDVASSISIPTGSILAGETLIEYGHEGYIFQTSISLREDLQDDELYYVAFHELGHVVGLDHDSCAESIMVTPMLMGYPYSLQQEDIDRLRAIYGPRL